MYVKFHIYKHKIRKQASIAYVTGDDVTYGVPKYATALKKVAADRNIALNYNLELTEVTQRGAVFRNNRDGVVTLPYNFLHVTPRMRPPACLIRCSELITESGYLNVDQWTLQHKTFGNVFGIGDCLCTPNSKTAAAVANQNPVVERNLSSAMMGKKLTAKYNGYGACPILTSYGTGMLAEFIYDKQVQETFPFDQHKIRKQASIAYVTGDDVTYGVPKYATALKKVAADRNIALNYNLELTEVTQRGAVFRNNRDGVVTLPYNFLHVTPRMRPPACLIRCSELITESGYLNVDQWTLQHKTFGNVFGIGDCLCTPNSKTAAAVANQNPVVERNLSSAMMGKKLTAKYNGYGACPILTSYGTGMLAEFIYDKQVQETFPFDQSKESKILYKLKTDIIPYLYWNRLLKGKWSGPANIRRIINPFAK